MIDAEPTRSTLSNDDPSANNRHYDDWRLHLAGGETVQIDLESSAFDSYLELWRPGGAQAVADNDDRSYGILHSRLIFSAPADGDYVVRAQHLYGGHGEYILSARRQTSTAQATELPADVSVPGTIGRDSPVLADPARAGEGLRYNEYFFRGAEGDRVRVEMTSGVIDPRLQLLDPEGVVIETDNNGGDGLNSRIVAVLPRGGVYRLRAGAPSEQSGRYALELRLFRALPTNVPLLVPGQPVDGELGRRDSAVSLRSGDRARVDFFYNLYRLRVYQGVPVTLTMTATGFDPVIEAGTMAPLLGLNKFAAAETSDEDTDRTTARLVLNPRGSGIIVVRARAVGSNTGRFRLNVSGGAQPAPARR